MKKAQALPLSEQFPPVLPRKLWRWNGLLVGAGVGIATMAILYRMAGVSLFPGSTWVLSAVALVILAPAVILVIRHQRLIRNLRRTRWPVEVIYLDERKPRGYIIQMDGSRTTARVENVYSVPSGEPASGLFREADYKDGSRELGSAMVLYADRDPETWTGAWPMVFRGN